VSIAAVPGCATITPTVGAGLGGGSFFAPHAASVSSEAERTKRAGWERDIMCGALLMRVLPDDVSAEMPSMTKK
jgi:hypothetical protein